MNLAIFLFEELPSQNLVAAFLIELPFNPFSIGFRQSSSRSVPLPFQAQWSNFKQKIAEMAARMEAMTIAQTTGIDQMMNQEAQFNAQVDDLRPENEALRAERRSGGGEVADASKREECRAGMQMRRSAGLWGVDSVHRRRVNRA